MNKKLRCRPILLKYILDQELIPYRYSLLLCFLLLFLLLLLLGRHSSQKAYLKLRRFKSDHHKIWRDCFYVVTGHLDIVLMLIYTRSLSDYIAVS